MAVAVLTATCWVGCASAWRLEVSSLDVAAGVAETYRFSPKHLTVTRRTAGGPLRQVLVRRELTETEVQEVLSALGLFHQARTARTYRRAGVTDGSILTIRYVINTHRRETTLQNVYLEPVGTLVRRLVPLLPEGTRLSTYFILGPLGSTAPSSNKAKLPG